jgi:outer membrane protein
MDVKLIGLMSAALLAIVPAVRAQQAPVKVAIINIEQAILATKDGAKAQEQMRTKFEPRQKDLESRMGDINKRRDQLQKTAQTLSDEAKSKMSRDIEDLQKKYQWDAEDFQNDVQQEQQKLVAEIGQRMLVVIDEFAKAGNYTIIFDVSSQQSPLVWAANGIEITRDVVELYDKKYGASTAAPAATPSAPAAKPAAPPAAASKKPAGVK